MSFHVFAHKHEIELLQWQLAAWVAVELGKFLVVHVQRCGQRVKARGGGSIMTNFSKVPYMIASLRCCMVELLDTRLFNLYLLG